MYEIAGCLRELIAWNKVIVPHAKTTYQLSDMFMFRLSEVSGLVDEIINVDSWTTL